jgi:hypothetical protein
MAPVSWSISDIAKKVDFDRVYQMEDSEMLHDLTFTRIV